MIALADFKGDWLVSRRICDARAGHEGQFEGRARFSRYPKGLDYAEEGRLHLPGQGTFTAVRRYLWQSQGGGIAVLFDDGRPFHSFDPAAPDPAAQHLCGPDTYSVAYDFTRWPRWSARWQVAGPRKAYVMWSCYAPFAGAETGK